ncbi:hypothetical protein SNARM312S_04646 [Streptomyces narbonensis]
MSTPSWSATVVLAKYAKTPTIEASKTMYARTASMPEAMPAIRPRPCEM